MAKAAVLAEGGTPRDLPHADSPVPVCLVNAADGSYVPKAKFDSELQARKQAREQLTALGEKNEALLLRQRELQEAQERMARELGVEMGSYTHRANSFHCYEKDFDMLEGYVRPLKDPEEVLRDCPQG